MDEMTMRQIFAEEIKERGGPDGYVSSLMNRWHEIDSELAPILSASVAAMKRIAAGDGPRTTMLTEILSDPDTSDEHPF